MVGQVYADLLCDFMFKRLFILAEIGNFTPTEYEQYEKSIRNMSDYYNIIDTASSRVPDWTSI